MLTGNTGRDLKKSLHGAELGEEEAVSMKGASNSVRILVPVSPMEQMPYYAGRRAITLSPFGYF